MKVPRFPNGFWTYARRVSLYTELKEKFGKYDDWVSPNNPKGTKESSAAYRQFKKQKSNEYQVEIWGKIVGDASDKVDHQIRWAIHPNPAVDDNRIVKQWFSCKCAGMDAGLIKIGGGAVPTTILCEY